MQPPRRADRGRPHGQWVSGPRERIRVDLAREGVRLTAKIRDALAPHHGMDVAACLHDASSISPFIKQPPGSSYEPRNITDVAEYVTEVLLERPSADPLIADLSRVHQLKRDFNRAVAAATELREKQLDALWERRWAGDAEGAITAAAEAGDTLRRWPGDEGQLREWHEAVFADGENEAAVLRRRVGFDAAQALTLERAVWDVAMAKVNAYSASLQERVAAHPRVRAVATSSGRWRESSRLYLELFLRPGEGREFAFTTAELSAACGLPIEVVEAFVRAFSLTFGEVRGGRPLLTGLNQVRRHPLVRDEDELLLATALPNLAWSIGQALESGLRDDAGAWGTYGVRRAALSEQRAASFAERGLAAPSVRNVGFQLDGDQSVVYEADALLRVGNVCFVLEVKSGELSENSRKGRRRELKQDLGELIGKSSRQAARLAAAIRKREGVVFVDRASGQRVDVDLDGVDRVEAVVVTLQDLNVFLGFPEILRAAGIVAAEDEMPWVVNLWDLDVMTATTEFAAQLTAYVAQRRALPERVVFNYELELWSAFLTESLIIDDDSRDEAIIAGQVQQLYKWHEDTSQQLMRMTSSQRRQLRRLQRDRPEGWLTRSEALIAHIQESRRPTSR